MRVQNIFVFSLLLILGSCGRDTTASRNSPKDSLSNPRDNPNARGNVAEVQENKAATKQKMNKPNSSENDLQSRKRLEMVNYQIRRRGIKDRRVLEAMERIPRHLFVADDLQSRAYDDGPLPIGYGQTISQPYIVALMTELVRPEPGDRALDIGTGCGYQAAVLSELVEKVYSIEILEPLAEEAKLRLNRLGHKNVELRCGDGYQGWAEHAPFQIIIVAAAPDHVPQPLVNQLAPNGRMVIPVGHGSQELLLIEKSADGSVRHTNITAVSFVPMTGIVEQR
jgi:protein-L-isoaspartate(D-aspartate) O-methyltransferase